MDARNESAAATGPGRRSRPSGRPAWLLLGLALTLGGGGARADDPPRRDRPTAIILEPPANRDALLLKLRQPDLWIGDPAEFERRPSPGRDPAERPARARSAVVGSVLVRVEADRGGDAAWLRVEYRITLDGDGPAAAPVGLDGLTLARVAEGDRDLAATAAADRRGWAVELAGAGDHLVVVEAPLPVRAIGPGRAIEVAIPPAASTRVELIGSRPLLVAHARADEPLAVAAGPASNRATARLGPRPRLELAWEEQPAAGPPVPAALAARGDLAVTIGPDAVETRAAWSVVPLRGTIPAVVFQLPADEEVLDVAVDRRPVAIDRRPVAGSRTADLVVALAEPIAPAATATATAPGTGPRSATIVLATRRPRPADRSGDAERLTLAGQPIVGARSQVGVVRVARSDLWLVTPAEGAGVRRVDPPPEPADAAGARGAGGVAFEFAGQPFDLGLQVEPAVPRFEVAARTTAVLRPDGVEVASLLAGRVWQGRLFEVRILAPPGLTYEPAGPAPGGATIRSERKRPRPADPAAPQSPATAEVLTATFPRGLGPGETFAIPIRGVCRLAVDGAGVVGLFQPLGAAPASTEVALISGPNRRFEPADAGNPRFVRLDPAPPPADWPWPKGVDAQAGPAATWLRAEAAEAVVPVRVVASPRSIHHQADLTVAFDRAGADVVAELTGDVANGTTDALEVALPPEVADRWIAEAGEALDREPLDPEPGTGWRRFRLKLAEPTDSFQVRVRHRLDFPPAATDSPAATRRRLAVRPIRLLTGTSTGQTVRLAAEPDVAIEATAPGWSDRGGGPRLPADSIRQVRRTLAHLGAAPPPPIEVVATLGTLADLPTLVASRLWLRSAQLPDGQLAITAQYRLEAHGRSVVVRLPAGSRWVRGTVGAVEVVAADVEVVAPDSYRITLPSAANAGPVPLRIDAILDRPPVDGTWPSPELVGGVVQQTAWELSLIGARAGVGVPAGWADENTWYRDGLLWKRRPRRGEADLAHWLADGGLQPGQAAPAARRPRPGEADGADDLAGGRHSYLFSRPGPPGRLDFPTYARSTLLLVCSGPVLLVGLLILARRPPPRWVAGGLLVVAFGCVAFVEPNTGWLVAESSSVGFALAAIAATIHRVLDRRARATTPLDPVVILAPRRWDDASALSAAPALPPGESNDPTVIRPDPAPDPDSAVGSTGQYANPLAADRFGGSADGEDTP